MPQNETFTTSDVNITFTSDELLNKTAYSLDGGNNVTISGNTTLADVPNGFHNVTVYAWDEAGNKGASETINFTVAVPILPVPFSVIAIAIAFIVVVALLIFFKRRRDRSSNSPEVTSS